MYQNFIKSTLDVISAFILLIVASPILLGIIIVLLFVNKGKLFFTQQRAGKNGEIFRIFKFKSLSDALNDQGHLLSEQQRLTRIGKILRRTSLDEIPQLINVLKGDMSIVGPRPLYPSYLVLYNTFQKRRHEVKPGITGWAQINGRNAVTWPERFALDVWYVKNISFALDIKVLFRTVKKVLIKEGVNNSENIDMPYFKGNEKEAP